MRPRRAWILVASGWTALALFFAVSSSLTYVSTGRPPVWSITITRSLAEWWLWALLTPLVVWLAWRFPLHGRHAWAHGALHLGAGLVVAVLKSAADRAIFGALTGIWMYWLVSSAALQLVVYGVVVGAAHGLQYYQRSREREQLEARLAETRLQLLSMQLQPHFLFNTLNAIAELVHQEPDTADRMITGLSELLRRTLALGAVQEVPLETELDLLALYLELQQARFGDRLRATTRVEPGARGALVPVLLLQPIVENAIRHGLAAHISAGAIDIAAARAGEALTVDVTNDGPGVDAAVVLEGIGLGNTRARLATLYPDAASLELVDLPGRGVRVAVRLPFRTALEPG